MPAPLITQNFHSKSLSGILPIQRLPKFRVMRDVEARISLLAHLRYDLFRSILWLLNFLQQYTVANPRRIAASQRTDVRAKSG